MKYELFIAERYLRSKRRTGFISLITYITAGGIVIGVAALVIVLSVMNGLETEVRQRIIGTEAHLRVTIFHEEPMSDYLSVMETVTALPHIIGSSPFIQNKGMILYGKTTEGAVIKGIDPSMVANTSDLPNIIVAGSLDLLKGDTTAGNLLGRTELTLDENITKSPDRLKQRLRDDEILLMKRGSLSGVVIGRQLAFRLGAAIGDTIYLVSPTGLVGFMSMPRLQRFQITGVFETGIFEYDDMFVYISLVSAQQLFDLNENVTGVEFKLDDMNRAAEVSQLVEAELGYPYYTRTWFDMHHTLFRWMKLEKWLYTILLSLIILVAAFNIVSSQIMMVLEKRREIGILKAIGAPNRGIMRIFLYEGLIVGVIGTMLGLILGWTLCWAQTTYKLISLPGEVYFLSYLPVRMQSFDFVIIALVALGLTLAATIYPARRAAALDPVEAIRYE